MVGVGFSLDDHLEMGFFFKVVILEEVGDGDLIGGGQNHDVLFCGWGNYAVEERPILLWRRFSFSDFFSCIFSAFSNDGSYFKILLSKMICVAGRGIVLTNSRGS